MLKNKCLLLFAVLLLQQSRLAAQQSYLFAEGIAVFYPAGIDPVKTVSSLAIVKELSATAAVPVDWEIIPLFRQDEDTMIVSIPWEGKADLYGNGETWGPLRRNGTTVVLWNTDNFAYSKANGQRLYQSHPWVMGVRENGTAFGIIADDTWKLDFQLANPIRISSTGPAFRVIIIEKNNPEELMQTLARLTGTMELPPLWALGYHQSRYSYYPDTTVLEVAKEFRKRKLPADVIWMDIDYMQRYKIFTFDSLRFAEPALLNAQLHAQQFKSVYMIDPGVKKEAGYTVYEQGNKGSHWVLDKNGQVYTGKVWPGDCVFPDFTRPATREWWSSLYHDFMPLGIDGVWNDMNEPAVFDGPNGTMPEDNLHRGGADLPADLHLRYHNVYGLLMVKASRDGIIKANPGKRPFVLSRANFLGGQRYAATWTGDNLSTWEQLKAATPMVLNLGLSGQPFSGPDVGGFAGSPDPILFAHWMGMGAFYPFFRNHTAKSSAAQEPWELGPLAEKESRKALNRRYRLLPYLYTLFREASLTGMPVMRPVFFADAKDTLLRREQEAFMWGKELLIIPPWARNTRQPKGIWRPLVFDGETPDRETIQPAVFIRGGAIIPLTNRIIQHTGEYNTDSLELIVCLDESKKAEGKVYLDAGDGFGYKKGEYALLQFMASPGNKGETILRVRALEGNWANAKRYYRVGLVTERGIKYDRWKRY